MKENGHKWHSTPQQQTNNNRNEIKLQERIPLCSRSEATKPNSLANKKEAIVKATEYHRTTTMTS
jgi:hypothetical protein